jgi:ABC-type nitrate/sulfonate/bicarbonate transport system substrate-binding protein
MDCYRAPMRAIIALAILLTASVGAAPADAGETAGQAGIKGDGGTVRLLVNPFGTNSFPPFVIQKFGLDKKYGFTLQVISAATTQAQTTAIQARSADIGLFDWNDVSRMKNAGIKVVGIAPFLIWANTVIVPESSPLRTMGDLKGKKLGLYSRTNLDWIVMRTVARKDYNIELEKEALIQEGAPNLLRGLLEQNQLDATQMFNSLTPAIVATGKFRVLATVRQLIGQLGLPDTPFLMYTADMNYAAAHPANVRAFLGAYRDAIEILRTDDAVWAERGKELKLEGQALTLFRDEAREDMMSSFTKNTEADIRKTFEVLLATAGPAIMGVTQLPDGFMTLEYQP